MADPDHDQDKIDIEINLVIGEAIDGEPYTLPVEDVLTGRSFITSKSGAGKPHTDSVVAEDLLDCGHGILAIDWKALAALDG